jgi:hypothetical protein
MNHIMLLDKQTKYYRQNRDKFELMYNNKFIVIKEKKVIGAYESHAAAYDEAAKYHEIGTFIIENPRKEKMQQTLTHNKKGMQRYNLLSLLIIIAITLTSIIVYIKYDSSLKQIDRKFNHIHSTNR